MQFVTPTFSNLWRIAKHLGVDETDIVVLFLPQIHDKLPIELDTWRKRLKDAPKEAESA